MKLSAVKNQERHISMHDEPWQLAPQHKKRVHPAISTIISPSQGRSDRQARTRAWRYTVVTRYASL